MSAFNNKQHTSEYKNPLIRVLAFTCCLFFIFSNTLFAQQAATFDLTSTISLNAEDEAILIGFRQFRENQENQKKAGRKIQLQIKIPNDKGQLTVYGVTPEFKKLILEGNDATVLQAMQSNDYEFKFPINEEKVTIGNREVTSPEHLLFRAAVVNHLEFAQRLVTDYELDLNVKFGTSTADMPAITVAVKNQNSDMVELLLNAGASPFTNTSEYSSPLKTAIENKDTGSARALFSAGATLDQAFHGRGVNQKLFKQLIKDKNAELVGLLLDNGMEIINPEYNLYRPMRVDTDTDLLSPLMEAILGGESDMIAVLLPHSDPRILTHKPISRSNSGISAIKLLPRSNALFLAQISPAELDPTIAQAITNRIEALGGEDAITASNISVASSQSDMAYLAGDLNLAKELLTTALNGLSANDIKRSSEETFVDTVKRTLLKKRELAIITGDLLTDEEQRLAMELADTGEPVEYWHSMLDIMQQATTGDYHPLLNEWQQRYPEQFTHDWDYSRLNEWIRTITDNSVQKRAFRALDFFEFTLSGAK